MRGTGVQVLHLAKPFLELFSESWRRLNRRQVPEQEKGAAHDRIVLRAALTLGNVSGHRDELDPRKGVVYEREVIFLEIATVHSGIIGGSGTSTHLTGTGSRPQDTTPDTARRSPRRSSGPGSAST